MNAHTTVHPKHTDPRTAREHARIGARYAPSVRELFPVLRERLLASRPIIGDRKPRPGAAGISTPLEPIYGKPTYRNAVKDGQLR